MTIQMKMKRKEQTTLKLNTTFDSKKGMLFNSFLDWSTRGSNQIITHARDIPGVIRRKDNSRTLKREAEKEKKQQAKLKKEEELKRLKNLKKQEIEEKLKKIQEMAGGDLVGLNELQKQLSNDFDPQDYDSNMNHVFTDEYYSGKVLFTCKYLLTNTLGCQELWKD